MNEHYIIELVDENSNCIARYCVIKDMRSVEIVSLCHDFAKNCQEIIDINPYYLYFCIYQEIESTELAGKDGDKYWLNVHLSEGEDVRTYNHPHYDNTYGSLYKVAQERGWNAYQFDIVKRIDRALKKGQFEQDLDKTIDVIKIWKDEYQG